jgi:N6-adenosine-specific RNA methylase IME4
MITPSPKGVPVVPSGGWHDPPGLRRSRYSEVTGSDRSASNHYEVMETEAICDLKVPVADDCWLFLWMRPEMLYAALDVVHAWGFTFDTEVVWVKPSIGLGKLQLVAGLSLPASPAGAHCRDSQWPRTIW